MQEVNLERSIDAPQDIVYGMLSDPDKYRRLNSNNVLVAYDTIEKLPDGGFDMRWRYSALGFAIKLRTYTTKLEPSSHIAFRTEGQIDASMSVDLLPIRTGTLVKVRVEFVAGEGLLASLSQGFITNQMRYSAETLLDNLNRAARDAATQPAQNRDGPD